MILGVVKMALVIPMLTDESLSFNDLFWNAKQSLRWAELEGSEASQPQSEKPW